MDGWDKHQFPSPSEIERIFDIHLGDSSDKKPRWYCESSELSPDDQKWISDNIPAEPQISDQEFSHTSHKVTSKVKGIKGSMVTDVSYGPLADILPSKKTSSKEKIAFKLADRLDDLESLPYYEKLVKERRCDFLKNCLVITLNASRRGSITKTKAAYFTGVIKQKTALQERIKKYKQKHTT